MTFLQFPASSLIVYGTSLAIFTSSFVLLGMVTAEYWVTLSAFSACACLLGVFAIGELDGVAHTVAVVLGTALTLSTHATAMWNVKNWFQFAFAYGVCTVMCAAFWVVAAGLSIAEQNMPFVVLEHISLACFYALMLFPLLALYQLRSHTTLVLDLPASASSPPGDEPPPAPASEPKTMWIMHAPPAQQSPAPPAPPAYAPLPPPPPPPPPPAVNPYYYPQWDNRGAYVPAPRYG